MRSLKRLLAIGRRLPIYVTLGLAAAFTPINAQEINEQDILNPFKQPNDRSLIWYGSGDVDSSGVVDWDDYYAMDSVQNDMADVDGDGVASDSLDIKSLEDYLDGTTPYLPGHWNQLQTREERETWIQKMLEIDKTDTNTYNDEWMCGNYATQLVLNFFGYLGEDIPEKYDPTNIGRFNLPVYRVGISGLDEEGHARNAILRGDDPLNFDDWLFIEPQTDVTGGGEEYRNNLTGGTVDISGIYDFSLTGSPDMPNPLSLVAWAIDSLGNANVYGQHSDLVLTRPDWISTLPDGAKPKVMITHPQQDSTYTSHVTDLEYIVSDENPDSTWYSTNAGQTRTYVPWGEPITGLQSTEGENIWAIYAKDKLDHESSDTVKFNIALLDTIPPEISVYDITNPIFSPNGDGIKDTSIIDLKFSEKTNAELTIIDSAGDLINNLYSPYYTVTDPEPKPWDGTYGGSDAVAPDGIYNIKVSLKDPAGNTFTDTSKTIILDTTAPEISITYPENDSAYNSHITELRYNLFDENPDSSWYSLDGGQTRTYIPWSSEITEIRSEQGENTWVKYAQDLAGNESSDTVRFNVDTTTNAIDLDNVVLPSAYELNQNYPNPFNPTTKINYSLPKGGPVSLKVYGMKGRELETLVNTTQHPGYYEVNFSAENLSSGVYFYRLSTEEFSKTRKMTVLK